MKSIDLKIAFMLIMAFFIGLKSIHAKPTKETNPSQNTFHPSLKNLLTISPHDYTLMTGKELGFTQIVKLKLTQQVFKRAILKNKNIDDEPKSQVIAFVICLLVGFLGVHRFYLGYTAIGIIQALTFGGCLIWWIIDIVLILTGDLGPADGSEYFPTFEEA